jgi:transcriptional regulator with XRE-family HTH domain
LFDIISTAARLTRYCARGKLCPQLRNTRSRIQFNQEVNKMNIYLAENIRRLRVAKSLTQERLADFLGVSAKAVSKWECGDSLPDIALLPPLANFFEITIDELMGNDMLRSDERIAALIAEYDELDVSGQDRQKTELAETAYSEFPNDWRVIHMRLRSLYCGYIEDDKPLLRRLANLILERCPHEPYRYSAINALLSASDDETEAEKWLALLPDDINFNRLTARAQYIWRSGDLPLFIAATRESAADHCRSFICETATWLTYTNTPELPDDLHISDAERERWNGVLNELHLLMPDGA